MHDVESEDFLNLFFNDAQLHYNLVLITAV